MMKAILVATALLWGGAAIAQQTPPDMPDATMAPIPSDSAPPDGSVPESMPATPAAPANDAMPPPSDPDAVAPATDETASSAPATEAKDYPRCSRKVRDNCVNPGGR